MLNSSKLLAFLHACRCGPPCRTYMSMVIGELGDVTSAPPADARLVRLNAAKLALYESIFLWEYLAIGWEPFDDMDAVVRLAGEGGGSLDDAVMPERSIDDGKGWEGSDNGMEDLFDHTGMRKTALHVLCEANATGAALPAEVVAFMAYHGMAHDAECAEDHELCFISDVYLAEDEVCELAALLRAWDIRSAFR